jgi:hypothetical protein
MGLTPDGARITDEALAGEMLGQTLDQQSPRLPAAATAGGVKRATTG